MKEKVLLFIVFVMAASLSYAQKRAFTIEDLYKVKSVGTPVVSNDGNLTAFTVTEYDLQKSESNTEIYLMNNDGSNLKKLTNYSGADFNPIWDKNDKGLYFVSYRESNSQLFYLPMDGGEARQITDFDLGVHSPKLSPNGKYIIFTTKIFPECGIDVECNKEIKNGLQNGPIQAHIADSLFVRHWTEYNEGAYSHIILFDLEKKEYKDLTPGYYHSPAFSPGGSDEYEFSPDSKKVVFTSKRVNNPEVSTNIDVFVVDINGENLRNLTKENKAADTNPKFSPDGKYISFTQQKVPTYESDLIRLSLIDTETWKIETLTENFDNWVASYKWNSTSDEIYFTAYNKGYHPLYKVEVDNKNISSVIEKQSVFGFDLLDNGNKVIYNSSLVHRPTEIKMFEDDESDYLTHFNDDLVSEVDIRPAEQVWIEGTNGKKIHCFIVKPHGFDPSKKYPLVLNVHGGPQYQWMDSFRGDWQVYPGSGYVVAFPNPHGSTGYGQDFTEAISGDWDGKVYNDVMKVADYLEELPYIDKDKMGAMGWSYGGYFMNLLQAKKNRFKCLASMMGIYDLESFYYETEELWFPNWDLKGNPQNSNLYEKQSPSNYVENFETPTLIITGKKDFRISYTQSLQYFTALQMKDVDSRIIIFENDGHWPNHLRSMPLYYNSHLEWFHKYLKGKPAPYESKKLIRNQVFDSK